MKAAAKAVGWRTVPRLGDLAARCAYRCAYRVARAYWFIRRPRTTSALVAVWHHDRVLLVRSSYRPHSSLPGGFLHRGEPVPEGAARELHEELGMSVPPHAMTEAWTGSRWFEHREDTITILEAHIDPRDNQPPVHIDRREIVWAGWTTIDEARAHALLPHVRDYLNACVAANPLSRDPRRSTTT